jgi:L-2,4-diaminobutyrate decarboxylase
MKIKSIYEKIRKYYPLKYKDNELPHFLKEYFKILNHKIPNSLSPRIGGKFGKDYYNNLINKYSTIPKKPSDPLKSSSKIVSDLFQGILRWRSPLLQYNVGSAVNTPSSAIYSLALDENIYSIDEGLAGNALVAEKAITRILSKLADLKKPGSGLFVFGGTATNLYATKVGLKKNCPGADKKGVPKNVRIFVTEDSHFTHSLSADWLGIGTAKIIKIIANKDRTSNIDDFSIKLEKELKKGNIVTSILLNGGTTYDHTVDEIKKFIEIRDKLVKKYSLKYTPHIHVDSVIGWGWLFFKEYDFKKNNLNLSKNCLEKIKKQYLKISQLKYADSWGVDFHKGIGGCPVNSSIIMFNKTSDLAYLSKTNNPELEMHQLAREINYISPADYTLETSRNAGAALAALASLNFLGIEGYQRNLSNLVENTQLIRELLNNRKDISIINIFSNGFATMVRLFPPEISKTTNEDLPKKDIPVISKYIKEFYLWDYKTRILKNNNSPNYSFSSSYINYKGNKISAIKIYPVSPHYNKKFAKETIKILINQKKVFDKEIWQNKK